MSDYEQEVLRLPPQAIEAEQSVLGSMMLDNRVIDDLYGVISSDDFYRPDHRIIFDAVCALDQRGDQADVVTVSDFLNEKDELNLAGGLAYLGDIAKNTPNTGNVKSYAKIVHERAILRRLIEASNEIIQSAYQPDGRTPEQILSEADAMIGSILQTSTSLESKHIKEYLTPAIDGLEQRQKSGGEIVGIPTGFEELDKALLGLEGGEVYYIAGRPGMGKTAFALNIVKEMGTLAKALFISLEMPVSQLINRIWASYGVEHQRIRGGNLEEYDWPRLTDAVARLDQSGIYIDDTPALSVSKIAAIAKKRIRKSGKMPIVIDYLQIMATEDKSRGRYEDVTAFSNGLKALAKSLDVPVVVLSQLNRSVENRPNKRPQMSDLRESGAIEQDAGGIFFIYRDEEYDKNSAFKGFAEIIIGKARNAVKNTIILGWEPQYQRFTNLDMSELNRFLNIQSRQVTSFKSKKGALK